MNILDQLLTPDDYENDKEDEVEVVDGGGADKKETLHFLQNEYNRATLAQQNLLRFVYQIAGIAFPGFTALAGLLAQHSSDLPDVIFWLSPLGFALLYSLVLLIFFMIAFSAYYVRNLEHDLSKLSGYRKFHFDSAQGKALFSFRSGHASTFVLYAVILVVVTGLYVALVGIGFRELQIRHGDSLGALYVSVNIGLALTLLWILIDSQLIVRRLFDRYIENPDRTGTAPAFPIFLRFAIYCVLPRPLDVILKSTAILIPFFVMLFALRLPPTRSVITELLLVYLCLDVLAKQTTYIWNDILDWRRDRAHPYKRQRPLAAMGSRSSGITAFCVRTGITAAVSLWVAQRYSLLWLPVLVGFVYIYQYLYDHYGKRNAPAKLAMVSIGYVERALAGCLVALGQMHAISLSAAIVAALLVCWIIVYTTGVMASYYGAEARYVHLDRRLRRLWHLVQGHTNLDELLGERVERLSWFGNAAPNLGSRTTGVRGLSIGRVNGWFADHSLKVATVAYCSLPLIGVAAIAASEEYRLETIVRLWIPAFLGALLVMLIAMWTVREENRMLWTLGTACLFLLLLVYAPSRAWRWYALLGVGPVLGAIQCYKGSFEELAWISMRVATRRLISGLSYQLFSWQQHPYRQSQVDTLSDVKKHVDDGALRSLASFLQKDGGTSFFVAGRKGGKQFDKQQLSSVLSTLAGMVKPLRFTVRRSGGGEDWVVCSWLLVTEVLDSETGPIDRPHKARLTGTVYGRLAGIGEEWERFVDVRVWLDSIVEWPRAEVSNQKEA